MKNDYRIGDVTIAIPPTLLFSLVAKVPDVRRAVTMDFKESGNVIYMIGITRPELGASEYALMKGIAGGTVPTVRDPARNFECYSTLFSAVSEGLVRVVPRLLRRRPGRCARGNVLFGRHGRADRLPGRRTVRMLHRRRDSCSPNRRGGSLSKWKPAKAGRMETLFSRLPLRRIGTVVKGDAIQLKGLRQAPVVMLSRIDAKAAWKSTLQF